jgi:hypothetical protein
MAKTRRDHTINTARKGKPKGAVYYSLKAILAALKATGGGVYLAAEKLGCDPDTIYRRAKTQPAIRKAIRQARGRLLDTAEGRLKQAVERGEEWAVKLTLKTLGKKRGYSELRQHQHSGTVTQKHKGTVKHAARDLVPYSGVIRQFVRGVLDRGGDGALPGNGAAQPVDSPPADG